MKSKFKIKMKNEGFTLMEVVVSAALVGVTAIGIMSLLQLQKGTESSAQNSAELNQARSNMLSMLTHPAHCNANFYDATTSSASRTDFYKCDSMTSGSCHGSGVSSFYPVNNSSWTASLIAPRLRLRSLSRSIEDITATPSSPKVTTGKLDAVFEIRQENGTTRQISFQFVAPVIFNGTRVTGCPNTWGGTVPY